MTSTESGGSSNTNSIQQAEAGTGHFMLTLCRLPAPVSIRPPQSPHLKPFTFFTSREPQSDGSERLYLHMGYFQTLADAERWVNAVRGRYPEAIASLAATALVPPPAAEAPASPQAGLPPVSGSGDPAPAKDESLTDTQVIKILEMRGSPEVADGVAERDPIALLRPEDTSTRQAIKAAVAEGAPVSFAVQLQWSAEPIEPSRVPSLAIFKGHTLYAVESRREGRSRYFLRVGFFEDPVSAKQVATQVRSNFASAAVVPVEEREVARARAAGTGSSSIPCLVQQRVDPVVTSNSEATSATAAKPPRDMAPPLSRRPKTLMQALRQLAAKEMWTDPDSLSESGVRHLKVEVNERMSRRS